MTTAQPIDGVKTDAMIEVALPLLDMARANIEAIKKPTDQNPDVLAGSALSMAIQGLVMAEFSQFKAHKREGPRAVEVSGDQLQNRFYGVGQGVGMIVATLLAETPELMTPLLMTIMDGVAQGMVARRLAGRQ